MTNMENLRSDTVHKMLQGRLLFDNRN